jgi:hypothetical protein
LEKSPLVPDGQESGSAQNLYGHDGADKDPKCPYQGLISTLQLVVSYSALRAPTELLLYSFVSASVGTRVAVGTDQATDSSRAIWYFFSSPKCPDRF